MNSRARASGKTKALSPLSFAPALLVLGGIWLIAEMADKHPAEFAALGPVLIVFGSLGLFIAFRLLGRERRVIRRELEANPDKIVGVYLRTRRNDAFGNIDDSTWKKEIDRLIRLQLYSRLTDYKFNKVRQTRGYQKLVALIDGFATTQFRLREATDISAHSDSGLFSPYDYELHCATVLQANGWRTEPTKQTRDSGADLIATMGNWRVAVECKRYSQPVGNKAVQQVYTAQTLYSANMACVVAPSGFTKQAEREAHGLGVLLLHHSELPGLADRLGAKRSSKR